MYPDIDMQLINIFLKTIFYKKGFKVSVTSYFLFIFRQYLLISVTFLVMIKSVSEKQVIINNNLV